MQLIVAFFQGRKQGKRFGIKRSSTRSRLLCEAVIQCHLIQEVAVRGSEINDQKFSSFDSNNGIYITIVWPVLCTAKNSISFSIKIYIVIHTINCYLSLLPSQVFIIWVIKTYHVVDTHSLDFILRLKVTQTSIFDRSGHNGLNIINTIRLVFHAQHLSLLQSSSPIQM